MTESANDVPALKDYIVRPPTMEDVDIAAELLNRCSIELVGAAEYTADSFRVTWEMPDYDKDASVRLVFTPAGQLVGLCQMDDHYAPYVRIGLKFCVHPAYHQDGIGKALFEWGEARARDVIKKAPAGTQVVLQSGCNQKDAYKKKLLENNGMELERHSLRMEIEFERPPEPPSIPKGIVIRPFGERGEVENLARAHLDSFRDHYGFVAEPLAQTVKNIQYLIDHDPHYDPEMWFLAMDGEAVAGYAVCFPRTNEDPEMGWVGVLGVRRPWRRRGLGLALLQHSFGEFYKRGSKRAGLGVDASSLTGATRLYEKAGMSVCRRYDRYRKILRDGEDIATRAL